MKSLVGILSVAFAFATLSPQAEAWAKDCGAIRKACIGECNNSYPGDGLIDGLQRGGCRLGCDAAYFWCEIWN